jgi:putative addiction module component (TIGR02574 family)
MPLTVQELATQAITLGTADRAELADLILASLPEEEDPEVEAAWDAEIAKRVASVENGTAKLISAEEVHARARAIILR